MSGNRRAGAITDVAGDVLTLASSAPAPKVGDVVVASVSDATPNGFLGKVVSITQEPDGTSRVVTQPAKLTEAVPQGSVNVPITLSAADVASAPTAGLRALATPNPLAQAIQKNFACTGSVGASISGSVSITPSFQLTASWSLFGGVQTASFTGTVTEDAELRASIEGKASCELKETALLTHPIVFRPIVVTVGAVPIVITPQLQLYLDATGSVQAAITTGAKQSAAVTAGLQYDHGSVRPVAKLTNTFTFTPPTLTTASNYEIGLAPKFSFLIYGLAGPEIDTRVYVRLNTANTTWTLRAGLTAGVHLDIAPLSFNRGIDGVIKFEKVLARGQLSATPPPPSNTKTISNSFGNNVAGCSDDGKWHLTLGDVGGTTGITPPASITAKTSSGGSVTVPLIGVDSFGFADYAVTTSSTLTGDATAVIDQNWNPQFPRFGLSTGPCAKTVLTVAASRATGPVGSQVTISGRLTLADGTPVAGASLTIRWHSPSRDGKGQEITVTTAADGRYSATVTLDEAGSHTFATEYKGLGPFDGARTPATTADITVQVT